MRMSNSPKVVRGSERVAVKRANCWFGFDPMRRVTAEELDEQVADEIVPLDLVPLRGAQSKAWKG